MQLLFFFFFVWSRDYVFFPISTRADRRAGRFEQELIIWDHGAVLLHVTHLQESDLEAPNSGRARCNSLGLPHYIDGEGDDKVDAGLLTGVMNPDSFRNPPLPLSIRIARDRAAGDDVHFIVFLLR